MATEQQLEGIMSKRADSPYHAGRGDDWLKIKRLESDEFAVLGYTPPRGSRSGFGSLAAGQARIRRRRLDLRRPRRHRLHRRASAAT